MSDEKRINEIKKEDRKVRPLFFIILVICGIVGGVSGFIMASNDSIIDTIFSFFSGNSLIISIIFTCILVVYGISFLIFAFIRINSLKKLWADEEKRDENWDYIEKKLARLMMATSITMVLSFFLNGCSMYNLRGNISEALDGVSRFSNLYRISFFVSLAFFMFFCFAFFAIQKKAVDLEKIMNPEKKGSLYDFKFQDKWYDSFDEAEKRQVGIAGYKAYRIVTVTCTVMVIILIFIGMAAEITILPLITVAVIWISQIIAFGVESERVMNGKTD